MLRAGGFIFYKIYCQNLPIFERFLDRFRPNNSQKPKNFRALRAHDFWGPQKISRASRGRFYFLQNPDLMFYKIEEILFFYKILKFLLREVSRRGGLILTPRYYKGRESIPAWKFGTLKREAQKSGTSSSGTLSRSSCRLCDCLGTAQCACALQNRSWM